MTDYALRLSDDEIGRYRMMAELARRDEGDGWRAAGIVPGAKVADVGCGPGAPLVLMAEAVGPEGSVTGVDADPAALARAEAMVAAAGVTNATLREGRADDTGLDPGSFDVVVMRHVLAHNGGREQDIVGHLASLVRPGSCVYLVDVLLTGIRSLPHAPDLADLHERYVAFHRDRGNDPEIGLRLGQLVRGAGLDLVEHRGWYAVIPMPPGIRPPSWAAREAMVAEGHATAADLARWEAAFEASDAATERPTVFTPLFSAIGRRP